MDRSQQELHRTRVSVFMATDEAGKGNVINAALVGHGPVLMPGIGELFVDEPGDSTSPAPAWQGFFKLDGTSRDHRSGKSAVLKTRIGEARFAVTFGQGQALLDNTKMRKWFGVRIALGVAFPDRFIVKNPPPVLSFLSGHVPAQSEEGIRGSVVTKKLDPDGRVVNEIAVNPSSRFLPVVGTRVFGATGLTFEVPGDQGTILEIVRYLYMIHQDVCSADKGYRGAILNSRMEDLVAMQKEKGIADGTKRAVEVPGFEYMLYPLLNQLASMARDAGPSELYVPIANSLNLPVMHGVPQPWHRRKRTFKMRVRHALRILEEADLVERVRLGRYATTQLGKDVSDGHVEITQNMLNRLYAKRMREGTFKRMALPV